MKDFDFSRVVNDEQTIQLLTKHQPKLLSPQSSAKILQFEKGVPTINRLVLT
jgi:hypothetical protein